MFFDEHPAGRESFIPVFGVELVASENGPPWYGLQLALLTGRQAASGRLAVLTTRPVAQEHLQRARGRGRVGRPPRKSSSRLDEDGEGKSIAFPSLHGVFVPEDRQGWLPAPRQPRVEQSRVAFELVLDE